MNFDRFPYHFRNERTARLVLAALFCAITFAATCIAIPAPLVGNVNLGDGVLLIAAWTLGLPWGLAAALGAALSDLALGYAIYAPATLIIKLLMVIVAVLLRRAFSSVKLPPLLSKILSALCAELLMVGGYYLFEATLLLHSFAAPLANIPFNLIQGAIAITFASLVWRKDLGER